MTNEIAARFRNRERLLLMTHVVAGYPDPATSRTIVETMAGSGADLIEIQIPFSDPLADGPTITAANRIALENGMRPRDCFAMVRDLSARLSTPLLIMTYVNIPFQMGLERFAAACAEAGAAGAIIPDLPRDEIDQDLPALLSEHGLAHVPVLSPGMRPDRIRTVLEGASGFVYVTLRTGVTGALSEIGGRGLDFLDVVRKATALPIAAGFGISSPEHIRLLEGKADAVVVGSRVIDLFNREGLDGVRAFLEGCRKITSPDNH